MKLLNMLKRGRYLASALFFSFLFASLYIYSQVLGIVQNIPVWFEIIPWYNLGLFILFSILFGVTLSYQIYVWRQPKVCSNLQGAGSSSGAALLGLFVSQCPACATLGALFLPASAAITFAGFLSRYSLIINLAAVGLLLFTLNYLGAFKE